MNAGNGRRWMFTVALALTLVALFEAAAWLFFGLYGKQRLKYHERVDDAAFTEAFLHAPPGALGWGEKRAAPVMAGGHWFPGGGRITPYSAASVRISSYGDSFTYCQDVKDDETWQYFLSRLTGTNVLNYGVRGYGTDQALLKLMRNLEHGGATSVVILGVLSENIARVVNVSPAYYWADAGVTSVKPILVKTGGRYEMKLDHLADLDTRKGRELALETIEKYDYWRRYNRRRPSFRFPYSLSLLQTAWYLMFDAERWPDLWKEPEPVAVMRELISMFYSLGERHDFLPVLLFIPEPYDLKRKNRGEPMTYAAFLKAMRDEYRGRRMAFVDAAQGRFDASKFNVAPYQGHASPYGNRAIARALHGRLKSGM